MAFSTAEEKRNQEILDAAKKAAEELEKAKKADEQLAASEPTESIRYPEDFHADTSGIEYVQFNFWKYKFFIKIRPYSSNNNSYPFGMCAIPRCV